MRLDPKILPLIIAVNMSRINAQAKAEEFRNEIHQLRVAGFKVSVNCLARTVRAMGALVNVWVVVVSLRKPAKARLRRAENTA